ncbi:MAG: hypothetical protein Q7S36_03290 [Candidatus Liptonbacteria bacterium]|nr:hypothetical protein [Candidatus Liptonbacteria bacterium]
MQKRLYFGHPVNTYNIDLENQLLSQISVAFPGWDIENPNQKHHQEGYKRWKEAIGNGMDYFFKRVLSDCNGGIFLPFRDGAWGAGVYGEAKFLVERGLPIWQITCAGVISRVNLNEIVILNVEETRSRIRTPSGETNPY